MRLPIYLETDTSAKLYERYGFVVGKVGEALCVRARCVCVAACVVCVCVWVRLLLQPVCLSGCLHLRL